MESTEARSSLPPALFRALFGKGKSLAAYRGAGCALCRQSGYLGRIGLFEAIVMSESLRALIRQAATDDAIAKEAGKTGSTMEEDGAEKVRQGLTTVEELLRVFSNDQSPMPNVSL